MVYRWHSSLPDGFFGLVEFIKKFEILTESTIQLVRDYRFRARRLDLTSMRTSSRNAKEKLSVPRDSIWPLCDKRLLERIDLLPFPPRRWKRERKLRITSFFGPHGNDVADVGNSFAVKRYKTGFIFSVGK